MLLEMAWPLSTPITEAILPAANASFKASHVSVLFWLSNFSQKIPYSGEGVYILNY